MIRDYAYLIALLTNMVIQRKEDVFKNVILHLMNMLIIRPIYALIYVLMYLICLQMNYLRLVFSNAHKIIGQITGLENVFKIAHPCMLIITQEGVYKTVQQNYLHMLIIRLIVAY